MIKKNHSTNAKENCVFIYKKNQKNRQTKESFSKQKYKNTNFLKAKIQTVYVLSTKLCVYIYMCDTYVITKLTYAISTEVKKKLLLLEWLYFTFYRFLFYTYHVPLLCNF